MGIVPGPLNERKELCLGPEGDGEDEIMII